MTNRAIIIFSLLLLMGLSTTGQEPGQAEKQRIGKEYDAFRRMFEEQRADHDTVVEDPLFMTVIHPEKLPDWTFSAPKSGRDTLYVLGISDPGMDQELGKEVALQRALQLWLLLNVSDLDNMREHYRIEEDDDFMQVYAELSSVAGRANIQIQDLSIHKKHVTAFDETIILAGIPAAKALNKGAETTHSKTDISLFTRLNTVDNREHVDETFRLVFHSSDNDSPVNIDQRVLRNGALTDNVTHMNDSLLTDLPTLNLRYRDAAHHDKHHNDNVSQQGLCLRNGLWIALVSGVIQHLAEACHDDNSIHFRHMGETYMYTNQALGREITGCSLILSVPSLDVRDNELFLLFDDYAE